MEIHYLLNPRGALPPTNIHPSSYYSRSVPSLSAIKHRRLTSYGISTKKSKQSQCYDWIFSSASNVHVAIDRGSFKDYVPFESYVLTVSEQRQVPVRGVGTVEVKIRRAEGSKEAHKVCLENVLHVPDWLCNIFSDIHFMPERDYEHTWTQFGVNFFKRDADALRPWGFTEGFCGLDRLVLLKNHQSRSPMLEDPDREVFSVSVTWSQGQRDKWNEFRSAQMKKDASRMERQILDKKHVEDRSPDKESSKEQEKSTVMSGQDQNQKLETKGSQPKTNNWKVMPDISALSAHMKKHSKSVNEMDGSLNFLTRMSSLNFEAHKARPCKEKADLRP